MPAGIAAEDRPAPVGLDWPNPDCPVAFVPVDEGYESVAASSGKNHSSRVGQVSHRAPAKSYKNLYEAFFAVR